MFEKNMNISFLADFYGEVLGEKPRELLELYYNEDLSLAEIAEHESITRQGVRDGIKRGEQTLFELESALGLAEKSEKLMKIAEMLERKADETGSPELKAAAEKIKNIL